MEVFEEKMRRLAGKVLRDADEKRREEKRLRKKEAWLQKKKEAKVAAMAAKRLAAKVGRQKPPGGKVEGPPGGALRAPLAGSELEPVDGTLFGRVAALERRLEEQEKGEERRVKEAYDVGRVVQEKKGEALMEELSQRSEERERKLTWELEEEKRKSQKQ